MATITDAVKRVLVGRPFRSDRLRDTLLPKRIALPVFASDALSSVAYAPDEIFLTLSLAGITALTVSPWIGAAVALVMLVVVASYRQNVRAYTSGGGDYEVAKVNLGRQAGITVASALLVDYVLTVAVSISQASHYASTALPALRGYETYIAIFLVLVITAANLRGVRESGRAFAVPTYIFIVSIVGMVIWGFIRIMTGSHFTTASANYHVAPKSGWDTGLLGLAGAFLMMRAFSSGCAALTGVEAIANGVPAFRKPKSKNAATTLLMLGAIGISMLMGIMFLADATKLHFVSDPARQLITSGGTPVGKGYVQEPVIGQLAKAVFSNFSPAFYLVSVVTGIILVLAANTAFSGFPGLASILARDGFLPRQLNTRGDRLAFSNGIITLAVAAIVLIAVFHADTTRLIQLYIIGVFVSFTVGQFGMVKHWTRELRLLTDKSKRGRIIRSRLINMCGLFLTGVVLIVVLITKFVLGAWIAIVAMIALYLVMTGIHRHYARVSAELEPADNDDSRLLPSNVHAIVLVSRVHKPTLRALAYARATRPSELEALTVSVDDDETERLQRSWDAQDLPVPLTVIASPYREITRPIIQYVRRVRRESPRDVVVIYIPEYVVGHWWEQILHNQTALRLKSRLLFATGVMVANVPWRLKSSQNSVEASAYTEQKGREWK